MKSKDEIPPNIILRSLIISIAFGAFFAGYVFYGLIDMNDAKTVPEPPKAHHGTIDVEPFETVPDEMKTRTYGVDISSEPYKGDSDSPITIVEFSDFECPFCRSFYVETLPLIEKNYIDTGIAKFVYKDYPLPFHPNAQLVHSAAECAREQGKFWEFHDILFENQSFWAGMPGSNFADMVNVHGTAPNWLNANAGVLGLDQGRFINCMGDAKTTMEIEGDLAEGFELGVDGTPTFFIGNEGVGFAKLVGAQPYGSFQKEIKELLE